MFASENLPCEFPTLPDCNNSGINNCQGFDYTTHCMLFPPLFPNGEIPLPQDNVNSNAILNLGDTDYPFGIDLGPVPQFLDAELNNSMEQFDLEWTNNTGSPINNITLIFTINNGDLDFGDVFLDDFEITNSCNNNPALSLIHI